MNPLYLLKTQLQNALNESAESEDFREAIGEALYSCDLNSVTSLEQWMNSWLSWSSGYPEDVLVEDADYLKGIKFVEDKWHQITGMF